MLQTWHVSTPRPIASKLAADTPFITGQFGGGKVEYAADDIDEIHEEWSEFVKGFIYRWYFVSAKQYFG
ncbi:unnamed protein product [Lactuca virosa]|uniref:Uncharacterized protein n=1 Tax=Lactuca virosa TaxID=75947 RepID=A0AAU9LCT9_9ASTR|nr:unnamed protein product [Lactuca virosa]